MEHVIIKLKIIFNMNKKILYFILTVGFILGSGYFFAWFADKPSSKSQKSSVTENSNSATKSEPQPIKEIEKKVSPPPIVIEKKILQEVPFVVQAPFGNWSDPNFQNGCEEASIVMAMGWVNGEKTISPENAQKRILDMIAFEDKTFGYSADTNAIDVEKIFKQYLKHENIMVKEDIVLDDIKAEIKKGNIVIVPVFGRALSNPNFTSPGPIAHMLVIIGYDPTTKQFITNDPGTKLGAGYLYGENLLYSAIWEYDSGKFAPPAPTTGKIHKAMISVSK